ncbi:MAG: hypothetical protein ABI742_10000 [Gemmatimonadota bacterium]
MTPIRPSVQEFLNVSLLADDQIRLRWLREDLTSCLIEVGAILRRASGEVEIPPSFSITIDTPASAGEPRTPAGDPAEEADASAPLNPPATITWTGVDGAALTYDWRSGALHRARAPG